MLGRLLSSSFSHLHNIKLMRIHIMEPLIMSFSLSSGHFALRSKYSHSTSFLNVLKPTSQERGLNIFYAEASQENIRNHAEPSPSWGATSRSAIQESTNILWNPNGYYLLRKNQPPVPILSQMNPVRTTLSCFSKNHFNIILSPTPRSS
jgi:hypothetical protein